MPVDGAAMEVVSIENNAYGSATYVVTTRVGRRAVVIDPGDHDTSPVSDHLQGRGVGIELIALTHEHYDHIAGLERLRIEYRCPVVCSRSCSEAIVDPRLNLSRYRGEGDIACLPADSVFEEFAAWPWDGESIRFIATLDTRREACVLPSGICSLPAIRCLADPPVSRNCPGEAKRNCMTAWHIC